MAWSGETWVALISTLVWPAVVVFGILFLRGSLGTWLQGRDANIKAGGVEISLKQAAQASALLGAAEARSRGTDGGGAAPQVDVEGIGDTVQAAFTSAGAPQLAGRILWVDDNPHNNAYERAAMEAMGLSFDLAESTPQGLDLLAKQRYDLVISDMGRREGPREGYALLAAMRKSRDKTPLVFYTANWSPQLEEEARQRGALGCTNRSRELVHMVIEAAGGKPRRAPPQLQSTAKGRVRYA